MVHRTIKLPKDRSFFLFGPRQVGKSSLLKTLFSSDTTALYDLLDSDLYFQLLARPALLKEQINKLDKNITHIIIDEIQRVPELLNIVHQIIESNKPRTFILSGSSARKLKRESANMLGGRALTYSLYPLTHKELGSAFDLQRALEFGTLPAVYLDHDDEMAREMLKSYVTTYLEEEIKAEAKLRNLGSFIRFLDLAASENGNIISYSNIAGDVHCDYKTVQEYYQILEDTLVGFFLPGYSKSTRKQISRAAKFYFFDTGVQRALASKLSTPLIRKTKDYGKVFEHFFIAEMIRLISYSRKDYDLSYYRTKDDAEVDLIVDRADGKCFAIEIKSSDSVRVNKLTGLRSFKEIRPDAELLCASLVSMACGDDEITVLPWQQVIERVLR